MKLKCNGTSSVEKEYDVPVERLYQSQSQEWSLS